MFQNKQKNKQNLVYGNHFITKTENRWTIESVAIFLTKFKKNKILRPILRVNLSKKKKEKKKKL